MWLIIPTRGRVGRQITFGCLPPSLRARTILVCPETEVSRHRGNHPQARDVVAQPDPKCTIAQKRKWILTYYAAARDKIVMLDDDLQFCTRRRDDPKKFSTSTGAEIETAFAELEAQLSPAVPHAGLAARGGCISPRAQEGGWQEAKRMMYTLGYHVPTVLANADPFRIETREDMDLSLQLLRKGFPNVVNHTYVVDQRFNNPGGAQLERNFDRANEDARELERLHPGLVRVVEKDYSVSVKRLEVVISWEKALREGKQRGGAGAGGDKARSRRA